MSHLDQEIDAWCRRVAEGQCGTEQKVEELRDHLISDIERLMAEGSSEEDAFHAATSRMGSVRELSSEYRKNNSLLATLAHAGTGTATNEGDTGMSAGKLAMIMIVQSLVWAAVMLASAWALKGTDFHQEVSTFLMAGWFASTMLMTALVDYRKAMRAECAFFRRVFNSLRRA
jgi:hypothetical protein